MMSMIISSFPIGISCNGSSLWGGYKGEIQCLSFVCVKNEEYDLVDVTVVHLPISGDNTGRPNLVYTDLSWIEALRCVLVNEFGMSRAAVDTLHYSEQGAQSLDYVHMLADKVFYEELSNLMYGD